MTKTKQKIDFYAEVTNEIVELLEQGVKPWEKPWSGGGIPSTPLRHNGQAYRGINVLNLWVRSATRGFTSPYWMTFKQAKELGGAVRKGEKATRVCYYGTCTFEDPSAESDEDSCGTQTRRFLKTYSVFNAQQIDDLPAHYYPAPPIVRDNERLPEIEAFLSMVPATIRHGGNAAYYSPAGNYVQMPELSSFNDSELYYATLAHELIHWTSHETRLDRHFGQVRFGDEGYAKEELVAEIGSAFLGSILGLRPDHMEQHAAYIGNWLKALKNDKRLIFKMAAKAQEASDFLQAYAESAEASAAA